MPKKKRKLIAPISNEQEGYQILQKCISKFLALVPNTNPNRLLIEESFRAHSTEFENYLQKALLYLPSNMDIYCTLAILKLFQKQYSQAIQYLDQVLAISPNHEFCLLYRGIVFEQLGDPRSAILVYTKLISINAASPYLFRLGICYEEIADYDHALECFNKITPNDVDFISASTEILKIVFCQNQIAMGLIPPRLVFSTNETFWQSIVKCFYLLDKKYIHDAIPDS